MNVLLRRLPLSRLLVLCAAVVVVGASAAVAAGLGSGAAPAPTSLESAIHSALTAPAVQGLSADVTFTNSLISSSAIQGGSSPLIGGASGRLWIAADGRVRLELQDDSGDTQILYDGKALSLFDGPRQTLYRMTIPRAQTGSGSPGTGDSNQSHPPPTLDQLRRALGKLSQHAIVSGPVPTDVAGQPAYRVHVSPRQNEGLIGGADIAWDAAHGVPLDLALYAKDRSAPVLELKANSVSYGPVPSSVFDSPSAKKVVDVKLPLPGAGQSATGAAAGGGRETAGRSRLQRRVAGPASVQAALPFSLSAPDRLAGLPRTSVRLLPGDRSPAALVSYGQGLGGIVVLERRAGGHGPGSGSPSSTATTPAGQEQQAHSRSLTLPQLSVNGNPGTILATALGTLINFQRAGISYTVVGSVLSSVATNAARGL